MQELQSGDDAPAETLLRVNGVLQLMPSCLRLYGHPGLLAIAVAINGDDFGRQPARSAGNKSKEDPEIQRLYLE